MSGLNEIQELNAQLKLQIEELQARQESILLQKKIQELESFLKKETTGKGNGRSNKKRRTKNAYMFFLQDKRPEIREALLSENNNNKVFPQEVCARAGAIWKSLSGEQKNPYIQKARLLKEEQNVQPNTINGGGEVSSVV